MLVQPLSQRACAGEVRMKPVAVKQSVRHEICAPVEKLRTFGSSGFAELRVNRGEMCRRTREACVVHRKQSENKHSRVQRAQTAQQGFEVRGDGFTIHQRFTVATRELFESHSLFRYVERLLLGF